jgi:hypothetical protein
MNVFKYFSLAIVVGVITSLTSVGALADSVEYADFVADNNIDYINSVISNFEIDADMDNLYLTDEFDKYQFNINSTVDNCSTYFLIDDEDDQMIGQFEVYDNGHIIYSDVREMPFNRLYMSNKPFAYGYDEYGSLVIVSENDEEYTDTLFDFSDTDYTVKLAEPTYRVVIPNNVNAVTTTIANINLSVDHVHNVTIGGEGKCWAACVAMKANREANGYSGLTATSVNQMCITYGIGNSGNASSVGYLLNHLFNNQTITQVNSPMTAGDIYNALCASKTIYLAMFKPNVEVGHAVLIKGITVTNIGTTVRFEDPNYYPSSTSTRYDYNSNYGLTIPECMYKVFNLDYDDYTIWDHAFY